MSKISTSRLVKAERLARVREERAEEARLARQISLDVDDYVLGEANRIAGRQDLSLSEMVTGMLCELVHNCNRTDKE